MGGNNMVVAVDRADVKAMGGNDTVVVGRDAEVEATCSTSIRGAREMGGVHLSHLLALGAMHRPVLAVILLATIMGSGISAGGMSSGLAVMVVMMV
uniref:Uncharacterized protein n=1 Tax=Romanomermis culicivorax TaxID=13658 RepID=A0A915KV02_ROMCU